MIRHGFLQGTLARQSILSTTAGSSQRGGVNEIVPMTAGLDGAPVPGIEGFTGVQALHYRVAPAGRRPEGRCMLPVSTSLSCQERASVRRWGVCLP